jgi:hypothetical protein
MSYVELTEVKGYNKPVYSIQELSLTQLQMLKEGISRIRMEIVSAENVERHKLLAELEELQNSLNEVEL